MVIVALSAPLCCEEESQDGKSEICQAFFRHSILKLAVLPAVDSNVKDVSETFKYLPLIPATSDPSKSLSLHAVYTKHIMNAIIFMAFNNFTLIALTL